MSFFEEDRQLGGEIAPGPPSTMWEIADAARKSAWYVDNWGAKNVASEEAYEKRLDDIFKVTGERGENPLRERVGRSDLLAERPVRFGRRDVWDSSAGDDFDARQGRFMSWLDQMAERYPEASHLIKPGRSPMDDAREKAREAEDATRDLMARYRGITGTGTVASFAGGFAGSLRDPLNVATMSLGPAGRAGAGLAGLAWMGLKQGAANAAVEAFQQPWVAAWRNEAGVGYDANAFWGNVGGAFAFGFAADAAVRGAIRGVQGVRGREAILDADGGVVGWRKPGEADAADSFGLEITTDRGDGHERDTVYRVLQHDTPTGVSIRGRLQAGTMHLDFLGAPGDEMRPEVVRRLARLIAERSPGVERFTGTVGEGLETGRLIGRAMDDDAGAIRELARRSGADRDERTRVLLDMLDDAEATTTRAPGIDPHASDWAETQAARHLIDPDEPPPAAVPQKNLVLYRGEGPTDPLRRGNRPGEWYTTDLERAIGYAGDSEARRGVFRIEVPADRIADLRRGIEGSEYMVPPDLHAGRQPVAGETVAARHELAAGDLGVLEMAALMRERPEAVDGSVPLSTEASRQADAIARLSDAAFDMVMRGEASPENAALVGRLVEDGTRQAGILADLERMQPQSAREARTAIGALLHEAKPVERAFDGIDDVFGPEGQRQVEQLERMLGVLPDDAPDGPAPAPGAALAKVRGLAAEMRDGWKDVTWDGVAQRLEAGEDVMFPPDHFQAQKAVLEADGLQRVPEGTDVGFLVGIRQGGFTGDGVATVEPVFRFLDGREATLTHVIEPGDMTLDRLKRVAGLYAPADRLLPLGDALGLTGLVPDGRFVGEVGGGQSVILHVTIPGDGVLGHGLRGINDHEVWHGLIRSRAVGRDDVVRVWQHARDLGVLDMSVKEMFDAVGLQRRAKSAGTQTVRMAYAENYRGLEPQAMRRMLGEEQITHFVQLYRAGHWTPDELAPVIDILQRFDAGEYGGRGAPGREGGVATPAIGQPTPERPFADLERQAIGDAPKAALRRGLDDAADWRRLGEVIAECKF